MVGCEDQQIVVAHPRDEFGQARVERLKRLRISDDVAAMAIFLIEVDEVGHDVVAVTGHFERFEGTVEQDHVPRRLDFVGDAGACVDVGNLADGEDLAAFSLEPIQKGRFWRRDCEVAAIAGALEGIAGFAGEGARDDAADHHGRGELEGDLADLVEALEAKMLFARGDLEDAVDRGVADRFAGADQLLAELLNDGDARCMLVAENARQLCVGDELVGQRAGETTGSVWGK